MILTVHTQLEAPNRPDASLRITQHLAALSLLNVCAGWSDDLRADFLRTVRQHIGPADATHWARLLDDGAMPDPADADWDDWYMDAVLELRRAYDILPRLVVPQPAPPIREMREPCPQDDGCDACDLKRAAALPGVPGPGPDDDA